MSASSTLSARVAPVALALLMAPVLSGCWWWPGDRVPDLAAGALLPATESPAKPPSATVRDRPGAAAPHPDVSPSLSSEGWIRTVQAPGERTPPEFRWRLPALEDLLSDLPEPRAELRRLSDHGDRLASTNAAIGLARLGDAAATEKVASIVADRRLKLPTRCAAAEGLGRLGQPPAVERLRALVDRNAYTPANRNRYVADLHAELIRALARHPDAADDRRFVAALRSPSPDVQLVALAAWESDRPGTLPVEAADLRTAHDPRVRAAALGVLARRRHPQAHEYLAGALHDCDVPVRIAAITALGELGDEQARMTLKGLLQDRAELVRAAAVSAMAAAGDREAVFDAAGDKSWRVRRVVAEALPRYGDRKGAVLARHLLDDPSTSVCPVVLDSVRGWPLTLAGPILLEAMGKRSYLLRKTAAEQLAARWAPAGEFSHEAPPERRRDVLDQLTARFRQEVGFADRDALAAAAGPSARSAAGVAPERVDEVAGLVRRLANAGARTPERDEAVRRLVDLGPELLPSLEQLALGRKQPLPEAVYREVLPKGAPVFETLDRLASRDAALRRRAAAELPGLSARTPLGPLAVERLSSLVTAEPDPLVWRSVLTAVAADGSEPASRIAVAALGHPSPEVRRRGCEHLGAHPNPRHARLLVPALRDPSESVLLAAIRALGAADRLDDTAPLEQLLAHRNETVRLATARALARFGSPAGAEALERMAHSGDPNVRREVAVAMGELADPAFTDTLIRLLDDGYGIRRAALESLPKVTGRDVASLGAGPTATLSEQVDTWKRWHERDRNTVGRRPQ